MRQRCSYAEKVQKIAIKEHNRLKHVLLELYVVPDRSALLFWKSKWIIQRNSLSQFLLVLPGFRFNRLSFRIGFAGHIFRVEMGTKKLNLMPGQGNNTLPICFSSGGTVIHGTITPNYSIFIWCVMCRLLRTFLFKRIVDVPVSAG